MSHSRHSMLFGAELDRDGVRFALWAPSAQRVDLVCAARRHSMASAGQGWWKCVDPAAKAGELYGFAIDGADDLVPDPASRFQSDDLDRRSTIVDPCAYAWEDAGWAGRPWNEAVIAEVHVGTATAGGTYDALSGKLPHYVETGITAVELMPLSATPGLRTWGYDGVLPYAPNNSYGSPDDLKRLVDRAHAAKLMVFLDVVYNHFGPTGNFLPTYAKSFFTDRHETPWGAGINFDGNGEASDVVREYYIQNALYWIEEFHIDGLRFDAVHAILDDSQKHFLDELAERVRERWPDRHIHLVLENEANEARRLVRDGDGTAVSYDAQWDDDIHHCWHVLLTGENESYYSDFAGDTVARLGRCLAEGFAYQGEFSENLAHERGETTEGLPPQAFVAFLQNHDQIGNRAQGERLTVLADAARLSLARAALLLSPQIPMLFMGDEWGATTPFMFFVNFENEPELEKAVREGRAREFEKFKSFGGKVPDPTAFDTFERSRLDWDDLKQPRFMTIQEETTRLLDLRQREIAPLMSTPFIAATYERHGSAGLRVEWRFEGGELRFEANFGQEQVTFPQKSGATIIWRSDLADDAVVLGSWTARFSKSAAQ